jgi:cold shock protein
LQDRGDGQGDHSATMHQMIVAHTITMSTATSGTLLSPKKIGMNSRLAMLVAPEGHRQPRCHFGRPKATIRQTSSPHGKRKMPEGTIKKLTDKGFGFIKTGGADDLFFHMSAVQGTTFEDLQEGQKVTYTVGQSPKGPRAENVTPV